MVVIVLGTSVPLLPSGTQRIALPAVFEVGHRCVIGFGQRNTSKSDVGYL